jgi:Family of unknown function (DUF5372)
VSAVMASPAASGSGRGVPADPVRALQHALYRAAKADPGRRFHALYDKICRSDVLWRAWVAVRSNNGAPGIDKITLAAVEEYGVTRLLGELASELKERRYRPLPARRVLIPKPGTTEQRPLSIPTRRHSAALSSDPLGFVIVTHPFHPLNGQRLEILYAKRRGAATVFVCAGGFSGQMTLPESWTDRGEPPGTGRLSAEGLAALGAATHALQGR